MSKAKHWSEKQSSTEKPFASCQPTFHCQKNHFHSTNAVLETFHKSNITVLTLSITKTKIRYNNYRLVFSYTDGEWQSKTKKIVSKELWVWQAKHLVEQMKDFYLQTYTQLSDTCTWLLATADHYNQWSSATSCRYTKVEVPTQQRNAYAEMP